MESEIVGSNKCLLPQSLLLFYVIAEQSSDGCTLYGFLEGGTIV